ncbi:MAG: SHOCT domain-containing protein [Acidimicrobiales bacterium]
MPLVIYFRGPGAGWWLGGSLMMLIFWGAVVLLILLAVRHFGRTHDVPSNDSAAVEALKMRFARGEIDADEFQRSADVLKHTT